MRVEKHVKGTLRIAVSHIQVKNFLGVPRPAFIGIADIEICNLPTRIHGEFAKFSFLFSNRNTEKLIDVAKHFQFFVSVLRRDFLKVQVMSDASAAEAVIDWIIFKNILYIYALMFIFPRFHAFGECLCRRPGSLSPLHIAFCKNVLLLSRIFRCPWIQYIERARKPDIVSNGCSRLIFRPSRKKVRLLFVCLKLCLSLLRTEIISAFPCQALSCVGAEAEFDALCVGNIS